MDSELLRRHVATHARNDIARNKMSLPRLWRVHLARCVSVHEAGHSVIARVLNVLCGDTSIADGIACGFNINGPPYPKLGTANLGSHEETLREWIYQGRPRGDRTAYIARAIAFMAGAEAEIAILGVNTGGDAYDREGVAEIMWTTQIG